MASTNSSYSASKYTNMKQTVSFPTYSKTQDTDDFKAKNWNLNQMRMNQSLNEFMKSMNKSTTDTNLDITNLDEEESVVYSSKQDIYNQSIQRLLSTDESIANTNESNNLNANSSTAEFKKYLEDLKRNYLEKLTFSCPSKMTQSQSAPLDRMNQSSMKSSEHNLMTRNTPITSLNQHSNIRRSLFFDSKLNEESLDENLFFQKKTHFNIEQQEIKSDAMFETPELTKTQILARLVQIREYLKQSYAMLSTLQTSNDLTNYASQMNKLHSLIDHLKEQEKGYLDLLNSFSKFQQLTMGSLDSKQTGYTKDILDLTDLNESVQQQHNKQQQQHNQILKEHSNYLTNLMSSANKSVQTESKIKNEKENEESTINSLNGSFISDTLTLNGVNCDLNNLYKYTKKSMNKQSEIEKTNETLNELVIIGKGYQQQTRDDDENKTENDLDLLEYEDENNEKEMDYSNVKEQRREILSALDSDLITLEQLKEQKKLLKSIRLRKEELKALEGRRKALEALRQIAMDSGAPNDQSNKSNELSFTNESDDEQSTKQLVRKTFKHTDSNTSKLNDTDQEDFSDTYHQLNRIEASSQIEKSKKTVQHYEDLIKKNSNENSFQNSLLKTVSYQEQPTEVQKTILNEELNKKITDLAVNEKKLEELYSMQSRLSQLKGIIVDFNGPKSNEPEELDYENDESLNNSRVVLYTDDENTEDERELNAANREQLKEHKSKLANAKDKLKQLQDLIVKLKTVSSSKTNDLSPSQQHKLEQKEASAALEILNEIEKQKQQDRLDELKRNKHKLLELLKQKENESAELAKLYSTHQSQKSDDIQTDFMYPIEINNDFDSAQNDLDIMLNTKTSENSVSHSPSDLLWSQMKKQLNMRENLRSKKQELEDLIRDENKSTLKATDHETNDENSNKIINGYRDFFLKSKSNTSLNKYKQEEEEEVNDSDQDEEEIIMKRYNPSASNSDRKQQQQQNICPTDELIKENNYEAYETEEEEQEENDYEIKKEPVFAKYQPESNQSQLLNNLNTKFNDLMQNQQQLNDSIQQNFSQLLSKSKDEKKQTIPINNQYLMASQFQFQTQMQVQQLMFNLNAAYHEIATQRTEMANLNEQMKTFNTKLNDLTSKATVTTGTNTTEESNRNESQLKQKITTTNALPSYFYNRRQQDSKSTLFNRLNSTDKKTDDKSKRLNYLKQTISYENYKQNNNRHEVYYTDDFEDCDEDEQEIKVPRSRTTSNASSTKTNRSIDTTTATNITANSSSSSNIALKQPKAPFWEEKPEQIKYKNQKNSNEQSMSIQPTNIVEYDGELFSFDRMREEIYSEVATLISQNETRPFFLLNLFRELQYLKDKNARDQALKSIFIINNRSQSSLNETKTESAKTKEPLKQDEDDLISFKYRMKKSEQINEKNESLDTSRTQSPFENDSLSNTVIFVKNAKNSPQQPLSLKYPSKKVQEPDFSRSSSSSIMGIQDNSQKTNQEALDKFLINQNKIEVEVKNFISKLIKSIKVTDNNSEYDDEEDDLMDDEDDDYISLDDDINTNTKNNKISLKNGYKYARCDSDYLNEIIDKVLNVLKQSSEHYDYLRLYQNQLSSYLKEALNKYENKRLIKCMEDILIDISNILYNELTFYSIMNTTNLTGSTKSKHNKMSRIVSTNIDISNQKRDENSLHSDQSQNLNLIKSLARKNNIKKSCNFDSKTSNDDDEESLSTSYQMQSNINTVSSSNDVSRSSSSDSASTSATSIDAAATNDEAIYYFDENDVKTKLNCFKSNKSDLNSKLESNYSEILNRLKFILNEKTTELSNIINDDDVQFEAVVNNSKCLNEIKLSFSDLKPDEEIKIEDLPDKLEIQQENLNQLDRVIIESISEDLVGEADALPVLNEESIDANVADKNSEDESQHSQKSENSDNFVMVSEASNISDDQVLVDHIDKKSDDLDQSLMQSENTTITELNQTN